MRLKTIGRQMVSVGGLQVAFATAAIYGLAALVGYQFDDALVLGMALATCANAPVPEPSYGIFRM